MLEVCLVIIFALVAFIAMLLWATSGPKSENPTEF